MKKSETPQMTAETLYKKNKQLALRLEKLTPIIFYLLLVQAVIFFALALKNSVGNITEILTLLDKEIYNATELQQNYQYLIEKWGEWELIGANSAGLVIRYVDVGNALFSGLMKTFTTLTVVSVVCAIVFGKLVFPLMAKHYRDLNTELVDMATLKSAEQINKMSKSKKEWF